METPVPLFNYVAHVRLAPVTDGDRTFLGMAMFVLHAPGQEEEMTRMVSEEIYEAGFAAVRSRLDRHRRRLEGRA